MSSSNDSLQRMLDSWQPDLGEEERLYERVRHRIVGRPGFLASRFGLGALVLGCILTGVGLVEFRAARAQEALNVRLARHYVQRVDPLAEGAEGESADAGSIDRELTWMRAALHLTPGQFARIRALHERSAPELRALAAEVSRLRAENAALERQRRTADEVDFLVFARLLETRREVDQQCFDSARQLVEAAATVMTPEQRRRFLNYVEPALPRAEGPAAD